MDHYITGNAIRELREKKKITQKSLAQTLGVSDKTISKWETGKGYPDISLLEPLAAALDISVAELLSGDYHSYAGKMRGKLLRHYTACTRGGGNGRCTQFLNRTGGG